MAIRTISMVLALFGIFALANEASADPKWYNAKVLKAGPTGEGDVLCQLTHDAKNPAFKNKYFMAADTAEQEVLAVCLGAISLAFTVKVRTDLDDPNPPEIETIYLQNK